MDPLIYLAVVVLLGLGLSSIQRDPRMRRSTRQYVAFTAGFYVVYLVLRAVGIEQNAAFATTFALFAVALVTLFAVQRIRRPT